MADGPAVAMKILTPTKEASQRLAASRISQWRSRSLRDQATCSESQGLWVGERKCGLQAQDCLPFAQGKVQAFQLRLQPVHLPWSLSGSPALRPGEGLQLQTKQGPCSIKDEATRMTGVRELLGGSVS